MEIVNLNTYNQPVPEGVSNRYPSKNKNQIQQPCLMMVCGVRNSGKSYLVSQMLRSDYKLFDVIYMVTPSFKSNSEYFDFCVDEINVQYPTRNSIDAVVQAVERDRDEWELYLKKCELYKQLKKEMKTPQHEFTDDELIALHDLGLLDMEPPTWKYERKGEEPQPPRSLVILDDVIGSRALLESSGLTKIATLNRHIAPLQDNFAYKNGEVRSACGLGVIILSQSYAMRNGLSRTIRENLTHLVLFQNKQESQLKKIIEELASVVPEELFWKAYTKATSVPHGSLCVDFRPTCPTLTFRQGLSKAIKMKELPCDCKK